MDLINIFRFQIAPSPGIRFCDSARGEPEQDYTQLDLN